MHSVESIVLRKGGANELQSGFNPRVLKYDVKIADCLLDF